MPPEVLVRERNDQAGTQQNSAASFGPMAFNNLSSTAVVLTGAIVVPVVFADSPFIITSAGHDIDRAFARMAQDTFYRGEAEVVAAEFQTSDWEALRLAESEE